MKKNNKNFFYFAERASFLVGDARSFFLACFFVFLWLVSGPFFKFSDTWQLIINSSTSILTFLIVFLIQNTQNRDTKILNLKIDELIKANKNADNHSIDLAKLTDEELKHLEEEYKKICQNCSSNK